jgi:hypothetical protein
MTFNLSSFTTSTLFPMVADAIRNSIYGTTLFIGRPARIVQAPDYLFLHIDFGVV